jgi:hypothetical protein
MARNIAAEASMSGFGARSERRGARPASRTVRRGVEEARLSIVLAA